QENIDLIPPRVEERGCRHEKNYRDVAIAEPAQYEEERERDREERKYELIRVEQHSRFPDLARTRAVGRHRLERAWAEKRSADHFVHPKLRKSISGFRIWACVLSVARPAF